MISFYLGLGLLLYKFKKIISSQPILSGLTMNHSGFDTPSRSSEFLFLKNWRDLHFDEHLLSRIFKRLKMCK